MKIKQYNKSFKQTAKKHRRITHGEALIVWLRKLPIEKLRKIKKFLNLI